jgi:hypothetical protein
VDFRPHYLAFRHYNFKENEKVRTKMSNCLGGGKYCSNPFLMTHTEEDLNAVKVNILSKCIYEKAKENKSMNDYYEFLIIYFTNCISNPNSKPNSIYDCALNSIDSILAINAKKCYNESFTSKYGGDYDLEDNKLLDADFNLATKLHVLEVPEIYINNQPFWGTMNANNVLEALCAGINRKPLVCYSEGGFSKPKTASTWMIVIIIFAICLGISVIIFILCKKFMDRNVRAGIISSDIDLKVNTVVTNYLALKDKV